MGLAEAACPLPHLAHRRRWQPWRAPAAWGSFTKKEEETEEAGPLPAACRRHAIMSQLHRTNSRRQQPRRARPRRNTREAPRLPEEPSAGQPHFGYSPTLLRGGRGGRELGQRPAAEQVCGSAA